MNEVVVAASRVEESILESPVSIEKLSLTEIRRRIQWGVDDADQESIPVSRA
jgi:hypothetical protein